MPPLPSQIDLMDYKITRPTPPNPDTFTQDTATVIALDPGGTTGWSMMRVHPDALDPGAPDVKILANIQNWSHGQIDCGSTRGNLGRSEIEGVSTSGEAAGIRRITDLIAAWPDAAIVIEDFVLRQFDQKRDLLSPVRITAGVNQYLWWRSRTYHIQSPGDAKTTATDARLKSWGLYDSHGGMQHARDADRHAITFLRKASMNNPKGKELRLTHWGHLYP